MLFDAVWPYIIKAEFIAESEMLRLIDFCEINFGSQHYHWYYTQKDVIWIYNKSKWFYHHVEFSFKHEEDYVLFKLAYTPEDSNG